MSDTTGAGRTPAAEDFGGDLHYNNGSNSNLDSDGKCALVFMPVEVMEAPQALN